MPQFVSGIDYTNGSYTAAIGVFGSVASAHTHMLSDMPTQMAVTIGNDGYQDLFGGGTLYSKDSGKLLAAADIRHCHGPQRQAEFPDGHVALHHSNGTAADG